MRLLLKPPKPPLPKQAAKHKRKRSSPGAPHFEPIMNHEVTAAVTMQVDRTPEPELAVICSLIPARLKKKKALLPAPDSSDEEPVVIAVGLTQARISKLNKQMEAIMLKDEVSRYTTEVLDEEVEKELKTNEELIDVFIQSTYKGDKPPLTNTSEECNLGSNKLDYLKLHDTQVVKVRAHAREKQGTDSLLFLVSVHALIK